MKEISEDIYDKGKEWGIGHRLNSQKSRNLKSFEEELDKSGIELTEEEMRHLTEVKEQGKVVTTEEYVQILIVLKKHGIDLTELRQDATINDMIKNRAEEEQQQILEELKEISEDIYDKGKEWGIGHRLNYQKSRNLKSFEEELEKSGIELTEEEMRYLTKVKEQGKAVTTEEYVQILIILKEHGIDLTELRQDATINDMIKNRTEEEQQQILEELKEISEDIYDKGKEWGIGHRLAKQKNRNLQKFKDELKKSGIELNEEEFLILTQKINKQKESKMKLNEIMQVLIILKQYGVDLTKIKQKSDIGNLLEDNNQKEIILNELKKQLKNINIKWPIGMRLSYQKNNNIEQFKTELYKYEKFINNYEIEYLIEKENNQQKSERLTEEFVQVLFVLKNHRVDLTGLQKKSKIIDMIKDKDKEEQKQILEELKQISEEINDKEEEWTIGNRLTVQKNRNIEQFKEKLEKSGIQLTSEELKHLTETKKQSKQITTDEFVQILVTLKQYEIDLINLKRNATIKDIIKDKDEEEQKQILKELKEITESINIEGEKWQIGKRLERQKSSNLKKFKDGLKKSGIKLTEKEEQYLTKIETNQEKSVRITQEFVQVLLVLKCHGVDLTELQAKSKISDIIKNKDEKEQKQILDELKEVSESIEIDGEKWPIGVRLSTQKNANIEQFKEELVKTQERLNLTEQEIHKMLDKGKDISRSEEMIQFIRRTVKEQKDNGTLGENYEVEKEFEETIRQAEQNIDKEDGER